MINFKNFYKRVNFDIDYHAEERFLVKQNDTKSRGFYVKIIQDGRVVTPSASEKLTFYGEKPDGTNIFQDAVLVNGEFRVDLPNQAFTSPGEVKSEFSLRGPNDELISTKDFIITVTKSFPTDPIESTDDFSALQQALSQIAGFAGEIQDVQLFAENVQSHIGDLDDLTTEVKTSIVNSINELNSKISNVLNSEDLETLLNAKVDKETLGDLSLLKTEEKTILVNTINELFDDIEEIREVSDVSTLLPLLNSKAEKSTVGNLVDLVDFQDETAQIENLVDAVNYVFNTMKESFEGLGDINLEGLALSEDLGDKSTLSTTDKTNLVNAINEINAALKTVEGVTNVEQLSLLLSGKADKSSLGTLANLTTTDKTNLVAALNEVKASLANIELTPGPQGPAGADGQQGLPGKDGADGEGADMDTIQVIIQTLIDAGLNEVNLELDEKADKDTIGNLEDLDIYEKSNLVAAINAVLGVSQTFDDLHDTEIQNIKAAALTFEVDATQRIKNVEDSLETIQLTPGPQGQDGQDGKSAYQSWLDAGNTGTEVEFLESLKGADGTGGGGSADGGSHSSNDVIENYTNTELSQVNASKDSGAGVVNLEANIGGITSPNWVFLGAVEDIYLVDTNYVYLYIYYETEDIYYVDLIHPDKYEEGEPDTGKYEVRVSELKSPSQVNASERSSANGPMSQVNASEGSSANGPISQVSASQYSVASGVMSQVNASRGGVASGEMTQVNASRDSEARNNFSQVNVSENSIAEGFQSQVNASAFSNASTDLSVVIASTFTQNVTPYSVALGSGVWGDEITAANTKIQFLAQTGDILNSGVVTSGHNFTDFAELFPNKTGVKQGYGLIQTIDGHGVRPANEGEQAVGVTSATAGIILGETSFAWQNRWLKDDWGDYVYHDILDMLWKPKKGEVESDRPMITVKKQNPEYNPELEHETRQQRPDEWTVVGLTGQVYVRLKDDVQPMDYVTPWKDGIGQASQEPTNLRVMKITKDYVAEDGYKIGFCLLK